MRNVLGRFSDNIADTGGIGAVMALVPPAKRLLTTVGLLNIKIVESATQLP